MLKGIKMAINDKLDPERVRIVMLMTDGFIGNESEIIAEVGRKAGDQIRSGASALVVLQINSFSTALPSRAEACPRCSD